MRSALLLSLSLSLLLGCRAGGMRVPGPLSAMHYEQPEAPAQRPEAPTRPPPARPSPRGDAVGAAVAQGAAELVDAPRLEVEGQRYRYDCSGMVAAAYAAGGARELRGGSRDLYAAAEADGLLHTRPRPLPGDVAFFDNTYDRNRNGRRDDPLTHVGVVESVSADGTITVVHLGSKGVRRLQMNLERPDDPAVNSALRATRDRDGGPVLAGELWRGFGSLWTP